MSAASERQLPPVGQLFDRYGAMVYRRCRSILGREEAARDAVQDIFLRVMEKSPLFRGEAAPSTWLYAMATLHCLQRLRDHRAHGAKLDRLATATSGRAASSPEDRLTVSRLLDRQSDELRLMVYLRYVDEMTMDEVADLVGYSRKTVGQRVQDFLASARAQLVAEGAAP
jgi:RNA polymerase sigma-70 factor, ECF subfamily